MNAIGPIARQVWLRVAVIAALCVPAVLPARAQNRQESQDSGQDRSQDQRQYRGQDRLDPPLLKAPTFSTSVSLVSITAVVRDSKGHVVQNLTREDFQVLEKGQPRPIVTFDPNDQGPVSMALLFDVSGSMQIAGHMEAGKDVVGHLLGALQPGADEVGLFTFDKTLHPDVPFTTDHAQVRSALDRMSAMGLTSLYDAIAQTAKTLADRPARRRAVVVITDGVDTSSTMTAPEVSGLASSIDVPVYVIAVVSPLDHPGTSMAVVADSAVETNLSNLATWTGGSLTLVSAPAHATTAARELIAELRQQYLLAVESATQAGWYGLEVRTRKRELNVRTRSGYFARGNRQVS
jgi:Ca-activated chloride channel homolog